ncbi:MAG TPA: polynucleotide adenylyltransferase PcnB [Candidatus Binataceae bacterium]|nr:polynucleotide adenylyltransferase PcnB [Candidatus Binataceae bacterium]
MNPRILERSEHPISRRDIDPNVLKVLYRLIGAGHVACIAGGGVRDLMLSRKPKDFDIATSAHPQQVRELFRNSRLIGRRFRLVHVFFGRQNIEVATFRRQSEEVASSEDPMIRLDNTFGTPEEDAFRRDFTVNALFYDPQSFRVIDFPGGVDDLQVRLIRTIGNPELRLREDPVRMMRAVRFAAKLGFEIEPATRAAIERHRGDLAKASVPRLVEETYRTVAQPEAARAIVLMEELGLLEAVLPFLSEHLKGCGIPLSGQPAVRNMAALGRRIADGYAPEHAIVLAALMLDLWRAAAGSGRTDLMAALRSRGFARGDTERMRLILDAFELLAAPSRRTRRLMRRPYFGEAQQFFEMLAASYGIDEAAVHRFLAAPPDGAVLSPVPSGGPQILDETPRRRRRRRRGRRRRRNRGVLALASPSEQIEASVEPDGHRQHRNGATSPPDSARNDH